MTTNDFKIICTGSGTHPARELYRFNWWPDDLDMWDANGTPQWSEMQGERERNPGRLVTTKFVEVEPTERGLAYRFRCPTCRPMQVFKWHHDLEVMWSEARHAGVAVADISRH